MELISHPTLADSICAFRHCVCRHTQFLVGCDDTTYGVDIKVGWCDANPSKGSKPLEECNQFIIRYL